ncbi:hypothetical protein GCM10009672_02780 [Nesterenkonia lutea]
MLAGRQAVKVPLKLILPGILLACITLFFGLGAELLMSWSATAAESLLNPMDYVRAVSGA